MIFVTVGTTIPFNELLEEVDRLAGDDFFNGEEIVCQGGQCSYTMQSGKQFKSRESIQDLIDQSSLVVSHGGLTIVQIMSAQKPFVCFPNPRAAGSHQTGFVTTVASLSDISRSLDVRDIARSLLTEERVALLNSRLTFRTPLR